MERDEALTILRGGGPYTEWNGRVESGGSIPSLHKADLSNTHLADIRLKGADLSEANLDHAKLLNADLRKANLEKAELIHADMCNADLGDAVMRGANLQGATMRQAKLPRADLRGANLRGSDLREANFDNADLRETDLRGATVNWGTLFHRANVQGCRIDRYTLECLGKDYGSLTVGDRMTMEIVDGVVTLRSSYSGFWQWIHLAALATFLFPYLFFVLKLWTVARFDLAATGQKITMWKALLRYIWNGGVGWQEGWDLNALPFEAFVFSLAYNLLRGILLWKTKTLELRQEASGLPVPFSLTGTWGSLYATATWGLWWNLVIVAYHTFHFMGQEVSLS